MSIRQVVRRYELEFNPQKEFQGSIPEAMLEDESSDERHRIHRQWAQFTVSVNAMRKTRRKRMVNKNLHKAIFLTGMENLCKSFSRRHLNIKVEFKKHTSNRKLYKLELVRMSQVPESSLNAPYYVADIPQLVPEIEVEAELIIGDEEGERRSESRAVSEGLVTAQILSMTTVDEPIVRIVSVEESEAGSQTPFAFQVLRIEDEKDGHDNPEDDSTPLMRVVLDPTSS